jgi:hypothetical protein
MTGDHDHPARIGVAKLTKMAFDGIDLGPLWSSLLDEVARDRSNTAAIMDMSVIAQLLGDRDSGRALQAGALNIERLYRLPCKASPPRLRLLVLAAGIDMGANTPVEFLVEEAGDIELSTLYVVPGKPLPDPLPAHDIAFVAVPDDDETRPVLEEIERLRPHWPQPMLNAPQMIAELNRDRLHVLLRSISGLQIPMTARVSRPHLAGIGSGDSLEGYLEDGVFPLIARPVDSHAGRGLAKLEKPEDIEPYLQERPEADFFIARFIDYSGADGLFRKYRVVMVDGRPYACHMAISHQWKIWYLNADMGASEEKRMEEARFMADFDAGFAERHRGALSEMATRIGLDYFAIDCAETKTGELLVFEADNAMIVHNMDSAEIFPYKQPQMHKIFAAFVDMLNARSRKPRAHAA